MATIAGLQIAKGKYDAESTQAFLEGEVDTKKARQATLSRAVAAQGALQQQIHRGQAERGKAQALETLRWTESEFEDQKIQILLQAFDAILSILHNIQSTASVMMGFTSTVFESTNTDHATNFARYMLWSLCICTVILLVHSVFVATLSMVDGTKLAYQGTRGLHDVRRAFHGLMARRSEVFWNFIAGFVSFNILVVFVVWVKLDDQIHEGLTHEDIIFGAIVSSVAWFFPVARMVQSHRKVRSLLKVDYRNVTDTVRSGQMSAFELDVGPQSVRKRAEALSRGGGRPPPSGGSPGAGGRPASRPSGSPPPSPGIPRDPSAMSGDPSDPGSDALSRRRAQSTSVRFALPPSQGSSAAIAPPPDRGEVGQVDWQTLDAASGQLSQAPSGVPSLDVTVVSARIGESDLAAFGAGRGTLIYVQVSISGEGGQMLCREVTGVAAAPDAVFNSALRRLPIPDVNSTRVRFEVFAKGGAVEREQRHYRDHLEHSQLDSLARQPDKFLGAVSYSTAMLQDDSQFDSVDDPQACFGTYRQSRLRVVIVARNFARYRQQLGQSAGRAAAPAGAAHAEGFDPRAQQQRRSRSASPSARPAQPPPAPQAAGNGRPGAHSAEWFTSAPAGGPAAAPAQRPPSSPTSSSGNLMGSWSANDQRPPVSPSIRGRPGWQTDAAAATAARAAETRALLQQAHMSSRPASSSTSGQSPAAPSGPQFAVAPQQRGSFRRSVSPQPPGPTRWT